MERQSALKLGLDSLQSNHSPPKKVQSIYARSFSIISKLYGIPHFDFYLFPYGTPSEVDLFDPFKVLWDCFRLGAPLAHLYNQLQPPNVIDVPDITPWIQNKLRDRNQNTLKKPAMQFLMACKSDLSLNEEETSILLTDLYKEDTNSFVKFLLIIERVINELESRELLPPLLPLPFSTEVEHDSRIPSDNRGRLITELLETERKYITDLESLQSFQRIVVENNAISKNQARIIFSNLDSILDFQRRFLIQLEG
ncbi:hypothetical protein HK096_002820, partial [Nowakowskiella sp. JEL0078]